MARGSTETQFIRLATKMGMEQMLGDVAQLLAQDLTPAQRIANEEMQSQIIKHLEELK